MAADDIQQGLLDSCWQQSVLNGWLVSKSFTERSPLGGGGNFGGSKLETDGR